MALRLGRTIRASRTDLGFSQERLAELADLSKNYVGNLERGEYEVSVVTLNRVAGALRLRASELLRSAGY
ncbi:MAG: helix-turn-helix domain-containing protein [Verrucomicrobia bacterium]|nr:helix-turn-helix domain-containing protein [Verrucomicrobiota bacterium]